MEIADAMATNGMKELGYEYINLDGTPMNVIDTFTSSHMKLCYDCVQIAGLTRETPQATFYQIQVDSQSKVFSSYELRVV